MNLWPVEHFFPPFFSRSVLLFGSTSYKIHNLVVNRFLAGESVEVYYLFIRFYSSFTTKKSDCDFEYFSI